jgi:1L-myo-inositol 1-phosphate cytidylyltransferase
MQCLIIAAGQGSRLRSMAASKPLAIVAGKPLIRHIIERARAGGATRFVVATGYEPEPLEAFLREFAESEGLEIEIARNPDWLRPNGHSVLAAASRLDGEFLLLMSDHLFDPEMLRDLVEAPRPDALLLSVDRDVASPLIDLDDATKVVVGADRRIVRLGKPLSEYDAIDTGLFRAGPALIEAIRAAVDAGEQGSLSEGVQRLADQGRAFALDNRGLWWLDVDDPRALALAEQALGGDATDRPQSN